MKNPVILLRISYWLGAILDALMLLPMLSPKIGGMMFGIVDFNPGNEYKYAMYMGASLMAGWTVLLLWADRKPVERKGILAITIVPVIIGLILAGIFAVSVDFIEVRNIITTWIVQVFLLFWFGFALIMNRTSRRRNR